MRNLGYENNQEYRKFSLYISFLNVTKVPSTKQNGQILFHAQISSREHPLQQLKMCGQPISHAEK